MERQDYVSAEIYGLTGLKLADIKNVKINRMPVVEFGSFKDISEFNIKYLIAQGVKSDYVRLESARNLKKIKDEKHVSVFQVIEKNGKIVKNYECYYLPERKPEVVKPETVSVIPTNADNNRKRLPLFGGSKEKEQVNTVNAAVNTGVTREEFDILRSDIDKILKALSK